MFKNIASLSLATALLISATPGHAADENHDKWIDVLSIDSDTNTTTSTGRFDDTDIVHSASSGAIRDVRRYDDIDFAQDTANGKKSSQQTNVPQILERMRDIE